MEKYTNLKGKSFWADGAINDAVPEELYSSIRENYSGNMHSVESWELFQDETLVGYETHYPDEEIPRQEQIVKEVFVFNESRKGRTGQMMGCMDSNMIFEFVTWICDKFFPECKKAPFGGRFEEGKDLREKVEVMIKPYLDTYGF